MTCRSRRRSARWKLASATRKLASALATCAAISRSSSRARTMPGRTSLPSSTFTDSSAPPIWALTPTLRIGSTTPDTVTSRRMVPSTTGPVSTAATLSPPGPPGPPCGDAPSLPQAAVNETTSAAPASVRARRDAARNRRAVWLVGSLICSPRRAGVRPPRRRLDPLWFEPAAEHRLEPRYRDPQLLPRAHPLDLRLGQRDLRCLEVQDRGVADLVALLLDAQVFARQLDAAARDRDPALRRVDLPRRGFHGHACRELRVLRAHLREALRRRSAGHRRLALEAVEHRHGRRHAQAPAPLVRREPEGEPVVAHRGAHRWNICGVGGETRGPGPLPVRLRGEHVGRPAHGLRDQLLERRTGRRRLRQRLHGRLDLALDADLAAEPQPRVPLPGLRLHQRQLGAPHLQLRAQHVRPRPRADVEPRLRERELLPRTLQPLRRGPDEPRRA